MRRLILSLTIATAFASTGVTAQTAGTESATTTTQSAASADAAAEARMNIAIARAVEAGVPMQLLENRIAEGRAKGVSMTRIAAVVEKRADVLARVQTRLVESGHAVAAGELIAAADAHERGLSLEQIANLSAEAGNDRAAALTVLADLVANGRAPEHALLRVQTALQAGGNALAELRKTTGATVRALTPAINAGANGSTRVEAAGTRGSVRASGAATVRIGG